MSRGLTGCGCSARSAFHAHAPLQLKNIVTSVSCTEQILRYTYQFQLLLLRVQCDSQTLYVIAEMIPLLFHLNEADLLVGALCLQCMNLFTEPFNILFQCGHAVLHRARRHIRLGFGLDRCLQLCARAALKRGEVDDCPPLLVQCARVLTLGRRQRFANVFDLVLASDHLMGKFLDVSVTLFSALFKTRRIITSIFELLLQRGDTFPALLKRLSQLIRALLLGMELLLKLEVKAMLEGNARQIQA